MTVTYLVAINVTDASAIEDMSAEIDDILSSEGVDVVSVAPWARPSMGEPEPLPPLF
jgi:hypothetical protein